MGGGALRRVAGTGLPLGLLALAAAVPLLSYGTHGFFSGPLDSPGTLQVLALCLVFGGVALSYDLLFGYTGLLSFGHALYFALGVYVAGIAVTKWGWPFWQALAATAVVGLLVPVLLGAVSLRVGGIAFAMVTLAFAQAGAVLVQKNPRHWTGGEEGIGLAFERLPEIFVGVLNTKYLYWLALGYLVFVVAVSSWATASSPGRVWQAIRENELRVQVLGLRPFPYKLLVFVLASFLATAGGVVYLLLIGGATPEVASPSFTLALLVMVVIGGTGTRWGAVVGGVVYTYLDNRLVALAGSPEVQELPTALRVPLSEPLFVLGALFVLIVFFLPGGIAGLTVRGPREALRALRARSAQPGTQPTG